VGEAGGGRRGRGLEEVHKNTPKLCLEEGEMLQDLSSILLTCQKFLKRIQAVMK
jgi:hypothetical protein